MADGGADEVCLQLVEETATPPAEHSRGRRSPVRRRVVEAGAAGRCGPGVERRRRLRRRRCGGALRWCGDAAYAALFSGRRATAVRGRYRRGAGYTEGEVCEVGVHVVGDVQELLDVEQQPRRLARDRLGILVLDLT